MQEYKISSGYTDSKRSKNKERSHVKQAGISRTVDFLGIIVM